MIEQEFVSFETAKLLKEKGFDEYCFYWYTSNGEMYSDPGEYKEFKNSESISHITAPTQDLAMRWLREVHHLHCDIGYDIELGWYHQIVNLKETVSVFDYNEMRVYHSDHDFEFHNYEEAAEAAIKYCLESLI